MGIGLSSAFMVGDGGSFRARGAVVSVVFLHKRLSVGNQDSWFFANLSVGSGESCKCDELD